MTGSEIRRGVVVTGGASGIGRAVATACASRGDAVVLLDIDEPAAVATGRAIGALEARRCDVVDLGSVTEAASWSAERLGQLDLVVHAAGVIAPTRPAVRAPIEDQRWVVDVNFFGTVNVATTFARILIDQDVTSHLVVTGSEHSLGVPHAGAAAYTASKHAVLGYADVMRRELPEHVHLSVLCPGLVATGLWRASEHRQDHYGGARPAPDASAAVMRAGMPSAQVAQAVLRAVDADDFLIVTHAHVRRYAAERFATIEGALDRQLPDQDDETYEVGRVIERLAAREPPASPA